jgi:hypothetical protein
MINFTDEELEDIRALCFDSVDEYTDTSEGWDSHCEIVRALINSYNAIAAKIDAHLTAPTKL